jgi:hypothetical protein
MGGVIGVLRVIHNFIALKVILVIIGTPILCCQKAGSKD